MKAVRWINMTLVAATLVVANGAVQPVSAQQPVPPAGPDGTTTTTTTTDAGAITNAPADATTSTTTTTTVTQAPVVDGGIEAAPAEETTELANTGGAPVLMSLMGLALAGSAFIARRRVEG